MEPEIVMNCDEFSSNINFLIVNCTVININKLKNLCELHIRNIDISQLVGLPKLKRLLLT